MFILTRVWVLGTPNASAVIFCFMFLTFALKFSLTNFEVENLSKNVYFLKYLPYCSELRMILQFCGLKLEWELYGLLNTHTKFKKASKEHMLWPGLLAFHICNRLDVKLNITSSMPKSVLRRVSTSVWKLPLPNLVSPNNL